MLVAQFPGSINPTVTKKPGPRYLKSSRFKVNLANKLTFFIDSTKFISAVVLPPCYMRGIFYLSVAAAVPATQPVENAA